MEAPEALKQEASWAARSIQASAPDKAPEAIMRARTYQPKVGRDFQCPRCWVRNGQRSSLRCVPSGTDEHDLLVCNNQACGAEVVVPL